MLRILFKFHCFWDFLIEFISAANRSIKLILSTFHLNPMMLSINRSSCCIIYAKLQQISNKPLQCFFFKFSWSHALDELKVQIGIAEWNWILLFGRFQWKQIFIMKNEISYEIQKSQMQRRLLNKHINFRIVIRSFVIWSKWIFL